MPLHVVFSPVEVGASAWRRQLAQSPSLRERGPEASAVTLAQGSGRYSWDVSSLRTLLGL